MTSHDEPTPNTPRPHDAADVPGVPAPAEEALFDTLPDAAQDELRRAFTPAGEIPDSMHFAVMAEFKAAHAERVRKARNRHRLQAFAALAAGLAIVWTVGPWLASRERSPIFSTQGAAGPFLAKKDAPQPNKALSTAARDEAGTLGGDKKSELAFNHTDTRSGGVAGSATGAPSPAVVAPGVPARRSDPFDLNADGSVDILDALAIARALKAKATLGTPIDARFDVNGDGVIDRADTDAVAARAVKLPIKQAQILRPRANQIPWCLASSAGGPR